MALTDADKAKLDTLNAESAKLEQSRNNTKAETKERNKWGRARQDLLKKWMSEQSVILTSEDEAIRTQYKTKSTAVVKRRWATCTYDELVLWLKEQGETPLAGISAQARRFLNAGELAAVRIKDDLIAVHVGPVPSFYTGGGIYDPGGDDPWTQNIIAVWLGDGEPDGEPEGL